MPYQHGPEHCDPDHSPDWSVRCAFRPVGHSARGPPPIREPVTLAGAAMIGKIRKGDTFGGLARYLTKDGRGRVLAFDNLSSDSAAAAASEMAIAAATSRRTQKPVLHLSISYAEGEQATSEQMREDARRSLKALGLRGHQAVIVAHDDTDHVHVHVMANRVGPDGRATSDSQSYSRVEGTFRKIEGERGWTPVPGRNAALPATGLRMTGHRKSRDPKQHQVPNRVRMSLLTAGSWGELHQGVRSAGWRLEVVQKGRGSGVLLIGPNGERVAAGKVDREATLTKLRRRLGRDPETRKRTLAEIAQSRSKVPGCASLSAGYVLAAALRPMLIGGLTRTRRSGPRLPGLPCL